MLSLDRKKVKRSGDQWCPTVKGSVTILGCLHCLIVVTCPTGEPDLTLHVSAFMSVVSLESKQSGYYFFSLKEQEVAKGNALHILLSHPQFIT